MPYRALMLAMVVAVTTAACGGKSDTPAGTPAQVQWSKYADVTDQPEVKLDWRDRPAPPKGFTDADMDTFARIEASLINKSISAKVARMRPEEAVDYVMSALPGDTKRDYESKVPPNPSGKHAWEWYLASLHEGHLSEPSKVIRVDWDTETTMGKLDDGTRAPYLTLRLQVFAVHTFGPKDHPRNVVVRRSVGLSGYKPNGGPNWWPSLGSNTSIFGNDGCALVDDSRMQPLRGGKYLKKDLVGLRKAFAERGVAASTKASSSDPKTAEKYAANCAKHPDGY